MTVFKMSRVSFTALGVLTLTLSTPFVALSSHQSFRGRQQIDTSPGKPAFVFSLHAGLNPRRSYSVTIDGSGAVSVTGSASLTSTRLRLSRDTLNGLLTLSVAEHFFTLPAVVGSAEALPDAGSSAITIHTTSETKTVLKENPSRNARFDQLYAVLSAVVGLQS